MMKMLVTGAGGLLGTEILAAKRGDFEIVGLNHAELDVTKTESIRAAFQKHQPDVIVNCAVNLKMDDCEANQDACFLLNRDAVGLLLKEIRVLGKPMTFIQISSSEAFGRVNEGEYDINGYSEDDELKPAVAYQRSKAEAEKILTDFAVAHPEALSAWYILRAAWLYGCGRKTFVEHFLEGLQKQGELAAIKDQWRSPTWAKYFVEQLFLLIEKKYPSGIYHSAAEVLSGEATIPQVIKEIGKYLGPERVKATIKEVPRDEFFKVPRAPSNVLKNTKLPKLPYWRDMLRKYLQTFYK